MGKGWSTSQLTFSAMQKTAEARGTHRGTYRGKSCDEQQVLSRAGVMLRPGVRGRNCGRELRQAKPAAEKVPRRVILSEAKNLSSIRVQRNKAGYFASLRMTALRVFPQSPLWPQSQTG